MKPGTLLCELDVIFLCSVVTCTEICMNMYVYGYMIEGSWYISIVHHLYSGKFTATPEIGIMLMKIMPKIEAVYCTFRANCFIFYL